MSSEWVLTREIVDWYFEDRSAFQQGEFGSVELDQFAAITVDAAERLAESTEQYLQLNGLQCLSVDAATELARHSGILELEGLNGIGMEAAVQLAKHEGEVYVNARTLPAASLDAFLRYHHARLKKGPSVLAEDAVAELADYHDKVSPDDFASSSNSLAAFRTLHKARRHELASELAVFAGTVTQEECEQIAASDYGDDFELHLKSLRNLIFHQACVFTEGQNWHPGEVVALSSNRLLGQAASRSAFISFAILLVNDLVLEDDQDVTHHSALDRPVCGVCFGDASPLLEPHKRLLRRALGWFGVAPGK